MIGELDFELAGNTEVGRRLCNDRDGYEPEVAGLLAALIGKNANFRSVFIDVGSNIGFFPLLAKYVSGRQGIRLDCFAHEPLPGLLNLAKALKEKNKIEYDLSSVAVSDFIGSASFYVSSQSDSSNSLAKGFRKAKEVIDVEVSTLDTLYLNAISAAGYDEVIIMMDVETSEPAVIRGGEQLIMRFRPLIICEVLAGRTETVLEGMFRKLEYSSFRFDGSSWILEDRIFGDTAYKYRDWFFVPGEREAEFCEFLKHS